MTETSWIALASLVITLLINFLGYAINKRSRFATEQSTLADAIEKLERTRAACEKERAEFRGMIIKLEMEVDELKGHNRIQDEYEEILVAALLQEKIPVPPIPTGFDTARNLRAARKAKRA